MRLRVGIPKMVILSRRCEIQILSIPASFGRELHEFSLGGDTLVVVMGDIQNIVVVGVLAEVV